MKADLGRVHKGLCNPSPGEISQIHMPLIQLSQLSGICGPLGKASATFYVCAAFKIRWGQINGKDRL